MPTYKYKCDDCGYEEDAIHKPSQRIVLACQRCGFAPLRWQFPHPHLHTDTTFMANRDDGFGNDNRSRMAARAKAKAAGVSTSGMVYMPGLCPPGQRLSPKAWIGGKADVKRICRENNWGCEQLGVRAAESGAEPEPYRVADDLVENEVDRIVERNAGDVTPTERDKLTHEVRERLTPTHGVA